MRRLSEWTDKQILDIGKFILALAGFKEFKHGMETGKLTDFADRYLRMFVKEFAKNPESIGYVAVAYMGASPDTPLGALNPVMGATSAILALRLAMSGSAIVAAPAAAYLATIGLTFAQVDIPEVIETVNLGYKEVFGDLAEKVIGKELTEPEKASLVENWWDAWGRGTANPFISQRRVFMDFINYLKGLREGEP